MNLSSSLHLFHSNFSRLPSAPQHLQCSTELSAATARMPIENNSTIFLLPSCSSSPDSYELPEPLNFSQNSTFLCQQSGLFLKKTLGCMLFLLYFLFVSDVYVMHWHLVCVIADSAVCIFSGLLRRRLRYVI